MGFTGICFVAVGGGVVAEKRTGRDVEFQLLPVPWQALPGGRGASSEF